MTTVEHILIGRALILVTGKGGVGKSVLAAALGRLLSSSGRRVLLLEFDPRETLYEIFRVDPSGGDVVDLDENLRLQHLRPRQVVERIVSERVKLDVLARKLFASPVFTHFVDGAPGLKELAMLTHADRILGGEHDGGRFDVVLMDAPATGHGLSLIEAPLRVAEVLGTGPVADLADRARDLVSDAARCATVVVTQAEEMPTSEALQLRDSMRVRLKRDPALLVVNGLYPELPAQRSGSGAPSLEAWRHRRALNDEQLERIRKGWKLPYVQLPLLAARRGPRLVGMLTDGLREARVR